MKKTKGQLCWTCKNACGGCSWSKNFQPVEGWKAEKTLVVGAGPEYESYSISECPKYEKEVKK